MTFLTQLLFIVLAVSLDGFTVGMTYGLRKISLTAVTFLIIIACSGIVVFCAMTIGHIIAPFMTETFRAAIGGIIFISLGIYMLVSILQAKHPEKEEATHSYSSFIENPEIVDLDRSGTISIAEAFVLGVALALDAFGAGIAAALLGFPILVTIICIAFASGLFVYTGFAIGHLLAHFPFMKKMIYIPPALLILIGLSTFGG